MSDEFVKSSLDRLEKKVEEVDHRLDNVEKLQLEAKVRQEVHVDHMESVANSIEKMSKTLEINTKDMTKHIMRTDILQDGQTDLREAIVKVAERLAPLEEQMNLQDKLEDYFKKKYTKRMDRLKKVSVYLGIIGGVAGVIYTIVKVLIAFKII